MWKFLELIIVRSYLKNEHPETYRDVQQTVGTIAILGIGFILILIIFAVLSSLFTSLQ